MSDHDHLTEDDLVGLSTGAMTADDHARVATHLDSCDACSSRFDEIEHTDATKREGHHSERPKKPVAPREGRLPRGTSVGRYVVIDVIGEGGMGVVYSAYDPELDRRVAIKLLQAKPASGSTSTGDQAWLLREAQALARLSHPNVIAVHDVGTLPGDRVFIAIELVEGSTLRQWLKMRKRSWREIRPVMQAAGAGLAAAHAAGLVHRDFKPENVLVGRDGRVRVMDFGLARMQTDEPASRASDQAIESKSPLTDNLTLAGSVLGTPAYMAPEIYDGVAASARSDQFSFGVALYEALFQARPFDKKALVPPRTTVPKPKEPPKSDVPARLQRIAMRAVAIDPAQRYESMDALLAELSVDPAAVRRRTLTVAGLVIAIGGVSAAAGAMLLKSNSNDELCKGTERRLAGAWDPATKRTVSDAFAKTSRPFKAQAFTALERTLDGYATEWTAAVTESCEATRIRGDQTEEVMSLRDDCFEQRLEELRAFTQLVAKADDALVDKASNAALGLEPVKRCANIAALKAPLQPAPEIRPQVEKARLRLADAKAGMLAGNFGRAINASTEAAAATKKIPFDPMYAEAELVLGIALTNVGNWVDALKALGEASWAGLRSRRDDLAALASMYAALATAEGLHVDGEARLWLAMGAAANARTGLANRELDLKRLQLEGIIAANHSDLIGAATAHEQALALSVQIYGPEGTLVAQTEQLLAATLARSGDYAKALPHYEHARKLIVAFVGPDHPDAALLLSGLGSCYHHLGNLAKSHEMFADAIKIRERVFGVDSPILIPTLNNTAELLRDEGNYDAAMPLITRARAITEKTVGKAHPYYVVVTSTMGEIQTIGGKLDAARVTLDESVKVGEQTHSPYLGGALNARAHLAIVERQWVAGAGFAERAITTFEASVGKEAADLWKPLTDLAIAKIELGSGAEATPLLERAIAIGEKANVPAAELAPTRAALDRAKSLPATPKKPVRPAKPTRPAKPK